jgi:hypothetical protein
MNRQQEHPVTPPVLRAVTGSATGNGTEPDPVAETAAVVPIPVAKRASGVVANAVRELWLHPDRLIHAAWHGNAKTLAQHRDYIKSRGWVPPEMTGKAAAFVTAAGIAYHVLIARYVKAACKAVDGSADYPLRFLGLLVFVLILVLLFVL